MTSAYLLRTERLTVRPVRESDIDALTAYRNDPEVSALQDWDLPYPRERAERLVAAQAGREDLSPGTRTQLGIELDGALVGDVYVGVVEEGGVAEIGFTLAREHQGMGYAVEAVSAVVDDLVDRLGIHRVTAQLSPQNLASARLLERIGMELESLSPKSYWWRGAWDDNLVYAMSADDRRSWRARPLTPPAEVRLVPITEATHRTYERLATHWTQQRFVATVSQSFGDALFPGEHEGVPIVPVLHGIEANGEPVGFLMYAAGDEVQPRPYLWRFLIDRRHQGRGIGRRALGAFVDQVRSEGRPGIIVSWVPGPGTPEAFYLAVGFVPTGEIHDGEVVARLTL
ncbi:MAG: N-acetyltransferase [Actinomycetales bacterium]|mgnify:CR=1 FL=1|nr:N-acetyltransferase [Actinomycetales bacterium]